jgi:membrane-bound serine protease (ClpP class)
MAIRQFPIGALLALAGILITPASQADGTAVMIDLEGPLGVATAEYIIDSIEEAAEREAKLVIIRMDTPGGLVEPMRDIVQAILASPVPVATWVSPGGARADSAGTYILLASHIAAMAPTTHLGAATPVSLGGGDPPEGDRSPFGRPPPQEKDDAPEDASDDSRQSAEEEDTHQPPTPDTAMERKVLNDAIAYIRGLAETHGRNADWAEKAVREAATLTASEALEQNVIDVIAADRSELLDKINGREVNLQNASATLDTKALEIEHIEPSWRIKLLSTISNPEIVLLLVAIGIYGLLFEGYNPGAVVPGVVGVICLLLAAYALQVIPVNYAGLALIVVGIALIVAEAFLPSFGALGLGGIAAFIFGAIMMFDSGVPGFGISITFVVGLAVIFGAGLLLLVSYIVRLRKRGAVSGRSSIVGGTGVAIEDFDGKGRVWLEGEAWNAVSDKPVRKDQFVVVRRLDGLTLSVEPIAATPETNPELQT